ncbi:sulfite exporter TauE/SafE family protein [Neobacillus cucumis]|uniref:sulfite exporter TauE/SafE family protein n=1 Tax=Bacillaceae TaxID=186817 RepID=UPI0018DF1CE5|nr:MULTISPECIES: sulfite exporter TauE/SafE family protein [Bacillaceae]MBI0577580.1 sulfite exporter TauE/SafE family protein [Neobacillus cucumis]MED1468752.1 sulfite exporter TauE/SafE family protein [Bacillus salipaludis]
MEWVILLIVGLLASSLGSLIGLGGGIIVVPALLYFGGLSWFGHVSPQVAVGTSLFTMIFTGLSSTLAYMKRKTVDYKSGLIFLIGSGPGSILGAWVTEKLNLHSFSIFFGIFIIFVSIVLLLKDKLKPIPYRKDKGIVRTFRDNEGKSYEYGFNPFVGILIAFIVGFLSGIFGVGGGSLMVPTMILVFFFPPHVAVATSMFMILPTSILSSITHVVLGNVNWLYALALIPGAWIGAKVGVYLNSKLKSKTIVLILRTILVIVGLQLIYEGIIG